jgi:hypothetical protein
MGTPFMARREKDGRALLTRGSSVVIVVEMTARTHKVCRSKEWAQISLMKGAPKFLA